MREGNSAQFLLRRFWCENGGGGTSLFFSLAPHLLAIIIWRRERIEFYDVVDDVVLLLCEGGEVLPYFCFGDFDVEMEGWLFSSFSTHLPTLYFWRRKRIEFDAVAFGAILLFHEGGELLLNFCSRYFDVNAASKNDQINGFQEEGGLSWFYYLHQCTHQMVYCFVSYFTSDIEVIIPVMKVGIFMPRTYNSRFVALNSRFLQISTWNTLVVFIEIYCMHCFLYCRVVHY